MENKKTWWLLLSTDNISTDINVASYSSLEDAQADMKSEYEDMKKEMNSDGIESELSDMTAYIYSGGQNGDLRYWNIKEFTETERYVLLYANNVDTDIQVSSYANLEDARDAMQADWEAVKADGYEESDCNENDASVYTGNNDLFYWNVDILDD